MALTPAAAPSHTVARRTRGLWRAELLCVALLAGLTFAVSAHFAPRGFRGGFTDMAHDGYQLRQVMDLDRGGTIFKDTFEQYGPLAGYLNLFAYRLLGRNLLAVKYGICAWYAAASVLLYVLARSLLTPAFSLVAVVLWLVLAPFYGHGVMISPHAQALFFQAAGMLSVVHFARRDRLGWLVVAGLCCGVCWALKSVMGFLFAIGVSGYLAARFAEGSAGLRRAFATQAAFLGAAAGVVGIALALLASAGALHDWYLQTILFPKAFYVDEIVTDAGPLASIVRFTRHFLALNFDMTNVPVAVYWHIVRVVVTGGGFVLWRRRQAPAALAIAGCLTPVLWLAAFPSAHYMHQWWTSSLSIAPFVYCVQRAVHALDDKWAGGDLVYREAFLTVAVLMLIFSSGIKERWRYARERQLTLTETYDAPASIRGIRTDARTLTAVQAMYGAIQNVKRHHPSTRIVSKDKCDGYTNCVPESLLWLSFLDDNTHDQPIYWPLPVLAEKLYPNYWRRFWSDVDCNRPLIVESAPGRFRPTNTINGYMLLVAIATQSGYWYVFAPEHPAAREHGETQVRLDLPPPVQAPPAAIAAANRGGTSSTPVPPPVKTPPVADVLADRDGASSTQVPVEGRVRDDMQLPVDLRGTERPRVYTWPADIDVPDQPAILERLEPDMATRASAMTFDRGRWIFRGPADAPFSYVLSFKERVIAGGTCFFATGHLEEGGISIGLQAHARWTGLVNVVTPGSFAVILKPEPGRYRLVLANNVTTTWRDLVRQRGPVVGIWKVLTGAGLPNAFEIDRAGWTSFGAGSASIPGR